MKQITLFALIACSTSFLQAQDVITFTDGKEQRVKVLEITPQEIKYKRFDNPNGPTITIVKNNVTHIRYQNGTTETLQVASPAASVDATSPTPVTPLRVEPVPPATTNTDLKEGDKVEINYYNNIYRGQITHINTRRGKATVQFNDGWRNREVNRYIAELIPVSKTPTTSDKSNQSGRIDANRYYRGYKASATGTFLTTFLVGPIIGLIPAVACSSTPPTPYNLNFPNDQLAQNPGYRNGYSQEAYTMKKNKVWGNYGGGLATWLAVIAVTIISAQR